MELVILTGGRGRRFGALTKNTPKAALRFHGEPLLTRLIKSISDAQVPDLTRIVVATGHLNTVVEDLTIAALGKYMPSCPHLVLPPSKGYFGTLGATAEAFDEADIIHDTLLIGVDVLTTPSSISRLIESSLDRDSSTMLLSPLLSVAPTHGLVTLHDSRIQAYRKRTLDVRPSSGELCDVGVRFMKQSLVRQIRDMRGNHALDFDDVLPDAIPHSIEFFGCVTKDAWRHFAIASDMGKPDLH